MELGSRTIQEFGVNIILKLYNVFLLRKFMRKAVSSRCNFVTSSPIHGLIFLFKWVQDDEPAGSVVQDNRLEKIFFAKQVSAI